MCIIPYATQQGEVSFCAYNTGIGWRNIIEDAHDGDAHQVYDEHGRHEIFAGGKAVPLNSTAHSLKLNEEAVRAGAQTDLDDLGIAKSARGEAGGAQAQNAGRNRAIRRWQAVQQHVLKEQPTLQIQGLGGKKSHPNRRRPAQTDRVTRPAHNQKTEGRREIAGHTFFLTLRASRPIQVAVRLSDEGG